MTAVCSIMDRPIGIDTSDGAPTNVIGMLVDNVHICVKLRRQIFDYLFKNIQGSSKFVLQTIFASDECSEGLVRLVLADMAVEGELIAVNEQLDGTLQEVYRLSSQKWIEMESRR